MAKPEVAAKEKAAISEYAIRELEYTPEEIQQVYDYRALLGLRNAWLNSRTVEATKKNQHKKHQQELRDLERLTDQKRQRL